MTTSRHRRPVPKFLRLLSAKVPVLRGKDLTHDGDACYGIYDTDALLIWLEESMTPERTKVTLVHETLHALIGVSNMAAATTEEEAVNRLAPLLLDFLRSNKAAVAYLQES